MDKRTFLYLIEQPRLKESLKEDSLQNRPKVFTYREPQADETKIMIKYNESFFHFINIKNF